jgi:cytolysin (calcineurin-like family phosphatase)
MKENLQMRIKILALFVVAVVIGIAGAAFGRDITFFVASDLHYGQEQEKNNEQGNKKAIALMNNLPGTAFPNSDFGVVQKPRGVLVTGDLTDSGSSVNYDGKQSGVHVFDGFIDDYPVKGGIGEHILYPVFEGYGNHDVQKQTGDAVLKGIASRNVNRGTPVNISGNGLHYSWDWDDVHFVNLNLYAGGAGDARESLVFLRNDLAERVGASGKPVVIMQHYGFDKLSTEDRWWKQAERDAFYDAIKKYKVIAIFTGHDHKCHRILWNGIPDFGAPKARGDKGSDGILAVRMLDKKMIVALCRLDGKWDGFWTDDLPAALP